VLGSTCFNEKISVAFALVLAFWCAPWPVILAFVFFLLCVAPHPVLGFLMGLCLVGFAGRNHDRGRTTYQINSVVVAPVVVPTGVPFGAGCLIGDHWRRMRQRSPTTIHWTQPRGAAQGVGAAPLLRRRWGRDRSTGLPGLVRPRGDRVRNS